MADSIFSIVFGGAVTLAGTVVTLLLQQRAARKDKIQIANRFFNDQVRFLVAIGKELEGNFKSTGEIIFSTVDKIDVLFNTFSRNMELLIFLEDDDTRNKIRDSFLHVVQIAQISSRWQHEIYNCRSNLKDLSAEDHQKASEFEKQIGNLTILIQSKIIELKDVLSSVEKIELRA